MPDDLRVHRRVGTAAGLGAALDTDRRCRDSVAGGRWHRTCRGSIRDCRGGRSARQCSPPGISSGVACPSNGQGLDVVRSRHLSGRAPRRSVTRSGASSCTARGGRCIQIVAQLGAAPLVQAWIALVARGAAAGFVRVARTIGRPEAAAGGCVWRPCSRQAVWCCWWCFAPRCTGRPRQSEWRWSRSDRTESLVRSSSRWHTVRTRCGGHRWGSFSRFASFGIVPLIVDGLWAALSRQSAAEARAVVAVPLMAQLAVVLAMCLGSLDAGAHPVKAPGSGAICMTVFSSTRSRGPDMAVRVDAW